MMKVDIKAAWREVGHLSELKKGGWKNLKKYTDRPWYSPQENHLKSGGQGNKLDVLPWTIRSRVKTPEQTHQT